MYCSWGCGVVENVILGGADRDDDRGNGVCKTEIYWWIPGTRLIVMEYDTNQCMDDER